MVRYLLLQLVLFCAMAAGIWWLVAVNRRDPDRFPLVAPLDPRLLALVVLWLLGTAGILYPVFSQGWVPKNSPLAFASVLGTTAIGSIAALMAAVVVLQRRLAAGWVTRVDDKTLRVQVDDLDDTLPLAPGKVVARLTPKNQWLRFDITHQGRTLQLLVMVPPDQLGLARKGEVVEFVGAPLGGSSRRFCSWMRPYIRS